MPEEDELPAQNEEEWQEMKSRFEIEGLDPKVSSKQKLLHIWRWLTDAENNLNSSRNMMDKLRNQHSEELKEVETYVEHIRQLSNEKIGTLEKENEDLRQLTEELRASLVGDEVKEMLNQAGLSEIIKSSLSEQVAYLLVLRLRLIEELEAERGKNQNLTDSLKLTQFQQLLDDQKADFEDELRHQRELTKQVKEELKRSHEIEIMKMQSMISSSENMVKELEEQLIAKSAVGDFTDSPRHSEKLSACEDKVRRLEIAKKKLETDNEALTYKVSEVLFECEEKENHLRKMQMMSVGVKPYSRRESILDSPIRFRSSFDNRDSALLESTWSLQMVKLERDVSNLQEQLASAGGRHEALALQYQQRRMDGRSKMQKLKDVFQAKQSTLKDQISELEASLTVLRRSLSWEKECRQKIQTDFAGIQKEKTDLVMRLIGTEDNLRDKTLQLKSLNLRMDLVEKDNVKMAKEVADIKKILMQESLSSKVNSSYHKTSQSVLKLLAPWAIERGPSGPVLI